MEESTLDLIIKISEDIIFDYDLKTKTLFLKPNIAKKLGLKKIYGLDDFINEHIFDEEKVKVKAFFKNQNSESLKFRLKIGNQKTIWYAGTLKSSTNYTNYLTGYLRDITDEVKFKLEEEKLKMLNTIQNLMLKVSNDTCENRFEFVDYLKTFFEAEEAFIAVYERTLKMEYWSGENKSHITCYDNQEILSILDKKYLKHNHCARVIYDMEEFSIIKSFIQIPFFDKDGNVLGAVGILNAKKEKMNNEVLNSLSSSLSLAMQNYLHNEELKKFSMFDMLTKVKNRNSYEKYINDFIPTKVKSLGIVVIDINGLKICNDTAGHFAGDMLICDVANHLTKAFGNDNVYRFGGDEFVVICENISEDLLKNEIANFQCSSHSFSVSLGYSYASDIINVREMQKIADQKMYVAKKEFYKNNLEMNLRKN